MDPLERVKGADPEDVGVEKELGRRPVGKIAHEGGREGNEGNEEEGTHAEPEEDRVHPADVTDLPDVGGPEGPQEEEADDVLEKRETQVPEGLRQFGIRSAPGQGRDFDPQHQEGHPDGEDAVRDGFKPLRGQEGYVSGPIVFQGIASREDTAILARRRVTPWG